METFERILCGVEGNAASAVATAQALALAEKGGGRVRFLAVYTSFELGPDYHRDALEASLKDAAARAETEGIPAETEMLEARYAIDALLPESAKHDLLVLGTHEKSRAAGIVFKGTASEAAHKTEHPLLIAREGPGKPFPEGIILAADGSPGSWAPARAAIGLAAAFGIGLEVIHVEDDKHEDSESVLARQLAEIEKATGAAPEVTRPDGHATKEIVATAHERGSSLIVAGRRGQRGLKSLGSVSERIVAQAECSVLLVPAGESA
jgi:nucleotide-binding universal stress UspA family protein